MGKSELDGQCHVCGDVCVRERKRGSINIISLISVTGVWFLKTEEKNINVVHVLPDGVGVDCTRPAKLAAPKKRGG